MTTLAKINPPRLFDVVPRARLFTALDECRTRPVVWIGGPPGAGKTALAASYLKARKARAFWFQVDEGDADPATLFSYLVELAKLTPVGKRKPLPYLTPDFALNLPGFTRRFFRTLFQRMGNNAVLVLDNCQTAAGDAFHAILNAALEEIPAGSGVIAISRNQAPAELARLGTHRQLAGLGWDELRLTEAEAAAIVQAQRPDAVLSPTELHRRCDGWVAGLTLLLSRAGGRETVAGLHSREALFQYFAGEIFDRFPRETRDLLLRTALFPYFTVAMAEQASGGSAGRALDDLYRRNYFIYRRTEHEYHYHDLFHEFLAHRLATTLTAAELRGTRRLAAEILSANGQIEAAIALYHAAEAWSASIPLILTHAPALLAQGRWAALAGWIGALPEALREADPWLLYWLGASLGMADPLAARAQLTAAFAKFQHNDDAIGQLLAAAGIVESHIFVTPGQKHPLNPWLDAMRELLKANPTFPAPEVELRVLSVLANGLGVSRLPDLEIKNLGARIAALLERDLDINLRLAASAYLLSLFLIAGDLQAMRRLLQPLTPLLARADLSPAARVFVLFLSSQLHLASGDFDEAYVDLYQGLALIREHHLVYMEAMFLVLVANGKLAQGQVDEAEEALRQVSASSLALNGFDRIHHQALLAVIAFQRGQWERARQLAYGVLPRLRESDLIAKLTLSEYIGAIANGLGDDEVLATVVNEFHRPIPRGVVLLNDFHGGLMDAGLALRAGGIEAARERLGLALAAGREAGFFNTFCLDLAFMEQLAQFALADGIEVDYVTALIKKRKLKPPSAAVDNWPWPVQVFTLGRFALRADGKPVAFAKKAPKKPLALLKALIALGGREVTHERLIDAIWPDAEGDAGDEAFDVTLRRLRKLLGDGDALHLHEGRVSLDADHVWVDAWAFDRALDEAEGGADRALALYRGDFLAEEPAAWALAPRERLRSQFIRHLGQRAAALLQAGQFDGSRALYAKGIETDALAEAFYQGLMGCYLAEHRPAEGLAVYRRLKQMLSVTLGIAPSRASEALMQALRRT